MIFNAPFVVAHYILSSLRSLNRLENNNDISGKKKSRADDFRGRVNCKTKCVSFYSIEMFRCLPQKHLLSLTEALESERTTMTAGASARHCFVRQRCTRK